MPPDPTILTLYCHHPDCPAFSGAPVRYEEGPNIRRFATLSCPHCGRPLYGTPTDATVTITLHDALRAYAALAALADRADRAADAAQTAAYRRRHERLRDAYFDASRRVRAAYLIAHARLKKRAMEDPA